MSLTLNAESTVVELVPLSHEETPARQQDCLSKQIFTEVMK
jgi:hypothetical protein